MTTSPRCFVFLVATLLAVFAGRISMSAAEDAAEGSPVGSIPIPTVITADETRDIIALSLANRGWTVREKSSEKVVGFLSHRKREATITFVIADSVINVFCVGHRVRSNGERGKRELPGGWIANINKDITKRLNVQAAVK